MNTNFDWSLVRSFLATLEQGGLLGAARALPSSQPTVGRQIVELGSAVKVGGRKQGFKQVHCQH